MTLNTLSSLYCRFSLSFLFILGITVPALPTAADEAGRSLDLPTIFAGDTFAANMPAAIKWLPSGAHYALLLQGKKGQQLERRTVAGDVIEVIELSAVAGLSAGFRVSDFEWQPDAGIVLLKGPVDVDWMGYRRALWYSYATDSGELRPLGEAGQLLELVKLAPGGGHAGFVFENNIYLSDLASGEVSAVTTDGDEHIFNGVFDYGSTEFGPVDGWRWAPTGEHIAFWRLDATEVPYYPLIDELQKYSEVRTFHYPNTGEVHAINEIRVFSVESGETRRIRTPHDPDDYLPDITWNTNGDALLIEHLTRDHKTFRLWRAALDGREPQLVVEDREDTWVDITLDTTPLDDGSVLWTSERSGFRHIYRIFQGEKPDVLTVGNWSVDSIVGVQWGEGSDRWAYFYAKKDSLIDQHVYRVNLEDKRLERLTDESGWHTWTLAPDGSHALAVRSDANTPHSMTVRRADGDVAATLIDDSVPALTDFALANTEFVTFAVEDGIELNAFFILPPDFDPGKKYPVIAYGYGNAGSQVVVNRWGTQRGATQDLWHRYLAQQGYVVFAMDNRTTAGRGKVAKNLTYGEYGKYAVLDYIEGVDFLKSKPWIDGDRIGFWGWSGGGYLAAALMTKAAPHFKVAVSVAPVIDLVRYQAVGVERWMGTPEENPEGYAAVDLMNFADRLVGKLLLIHGTGDENVKFSFTLQFADALIRANKQFDMLVYPNQRHGIADYRLHVFSTMTRYFDENL